jgi:AcrR family transcriptional regulator
MTRQLGKQALLDAAAVLMDERGVDNVTLQDISQASGHRNRSAVQYHFGSRDAVIRAVIGRHMNPIDAERNMLLDHLETTGTPLTTRGVIEIVILPLARHLRTPEGRRYFRLGAQLLNHPRFITDAREAVTLNTSITRCAAYILPSLEHLPAPVVAERTSQVISFIIRACGDQSRLMDSDPPPRPVLSVDDFAVNLVDTILAILQAPTSVASGPAAAGGLWHAVRNRPERRSWACSFRQHVFIVVLSAP